MPAIKTRRVGQIEIYVTDDARLFIEDLHEQTRWELTDEYRNRQIDEQLMTELEHRVRAGGLLDARGSGHGSLLAFLKSDRKT